MAISYYGTGYHRSNHYGSNYYGPQGVAAPLKAGGKFIEGPLDLREDDDVIIMMLVTLIEGG